MRLKKLWRFDAATLLVPIVVFATAITGSVATGAAAPTPVAAYSFDAGSGTTLADLSGNGNAGTISGATWTTGKNGKALSFDGVNDWVTVADAATLDLKTGMTLEAWVRPTRGDSAWRTVVFKESLTGTAYSLYTNERSNRPIGQVNINGERSVLAPTLPLNTWTHLAVTFDGSKLRLYANAALVGSIDVSGSIPATGSPLRIGGNAIWGEWFAGQIDDLRIYDRALSTSELDADMKTPVGATAPPPPPTDTQAPTAPGNLAVTGRTTSSVSVSWTASTDNTGVAGYRLYRDAAGAGTTQSTNATFSGLACGTTYAFAVEAYDAAGNKSSRPSVAAASADCPTSAGAPVAAYSFDAGSGTTLADISGKGNTGSIENATWSSGKNGGGLSFDGANDSVLIADSATLDLSTGMTLEAWVSPTSAGPNWRTVLFKETSDGTAYSLYASERNSLPVGQVDIGGERNAMGPSLPLNTWSHLAVTYDGSIAPALRERRSGRLGRRLRQHPGIERAASHRRQRDLGRVVRRPDRRRSRLQPGTDGYRDQVRHGHTRVREQHASDASDAARAGHAGAHGADEPDARRFHRHDDLRLVDGVGGQHGCGVLRGVSRQRSCRIADEHQLHVRGPALRDQLRPRRRRRRRGGESLGQGREDGLDRGLSGDAPALAAPALG